MTIRQIALAAKVSPMTVSLSLRNHPSISAKTRDRIQKLATKLGYAPDPVVAKLMQHLRTQRVSRLQASLCGLTTFPKGSHDAFASRVIAGAMETARSLGYGFDLVHIDETEAAAATRLQRRLRNRGVEGVLLLPLASPLKLTELLRWADFSVMATTLSVLEPHFHCVLPGHFHNTMLLCRQLTAAGHRRIGLVVREAQDRRVGNNFTAAFCWHNTFGGTVGVPPLVVDRLPHTSFAGWVKTRRLDAIVAETEEHAALLKTELRKARLADRPIATCSSRPDPVGRFNTPGVYEDPVQIGASAVELLARMVMSSEKGVPEHPRTTLIEGTWIDRPKTLGTLRLAR